MVLTYGGIIMGIIKNRTTLNGELVSLVANGAVGKLTQKQNSYDAKFDIEMTR